MVFRLIEVRRADDTPDSRYPRVRPDRSIAPEPEDGETRRVTGVSARVVDRGANDPPLADVRHDLEIALAAHRVVVDCRHWVPIHRHWGVGVVGAPLAVAQTLAARRRADQAESGALLCGHIRHAWLHSVSARAATSADPHARLHLGVMVHGEDGGLVRRVLELGLEATTAVEPLAAEISAAAAESRLRDGSVRADHASALRAIAAGREATRTRSGFASYRLPAWRVPSAREPSAASGADDPR